MCVHWGQPTGSASTCKVSPSSDLPLLNGKTNQPIYYEDAPVSCRLCLMMGGGVLIKICSKAVRSHLHFWWSWWWWWWWQWWRTLSHIDAQKPIYGIKCLWEFGCTPSSPSSSLSSPSSSSGGGLVGEGADADAVLALGETVPGLAGEDYPILAEVQCFQR